MIASKIGTEDIINIGAFGILKVTLPDYASVESVKNLVTRAKSRHPREDGLTFTTGVDKKTNTITIKCVRPEDVNRKNKL
jgi:hypothetical protein